MSFWELVSVFRDNPLVLKRLFHNSKWKMYSVWFQNFDEHVKNQNRQLLDTLLPAELVTDALQLCPLRFQVRDNYLYRLDKDDVAHDSLSAVEVYKRYGGSAIEEVLEYGSFGLLKISPP